MNLPDPAPVRDLIEAFRRSKTMFAAVSLGVFDRLHDAPATAPNLASAVRANAGALEQLLDGCAALGLLISLLPQALRWTARKHDIRRGGPLAPAADGQL